MKIRNVKNIPRIIIQGYVINNGVKLYNEFLFPVNPIMMISNIIHLLRLKFKKFSNNNFESGVYISHLRLTKPTDNVLAVGIGSGSTLIPIVKIMESSSGHYTCIEASESQIIQAKKSIDLNNLDVNKYEIINGYAGTEIFGSYGQSTKKNIDVNEFDFDTLELDCEGSELSILMHLDKTPRNIIVEFHPRHFKEKYKVFKNIINLMGEKGYRYLFSYGHDGDLLSFDEAEYYYNQSAKARNDDNCKENIHLKYFSVCPIIVSFENTKKIGNLC
jgi:hypothetical protein